MKFSVSNKAWWQADVDLLVVPCNERSNYVATAQVLPAGCPDAPRASIDELLAAERFRGRTGRSILVSTLKQIVPRRLLFVGLGEGGLTPDTAHQLMRTVAQVAESHCAERVALSIGALDEAHLTRLVTFANIATYRFERYRMPDDPLVDVKQLDFLSQDVIDGAQEAILRGELIGRSVNFTRDLVNEPACVATPTFLADAAARIAAEQELECTIFDEKELLAQRMNLLLAVASGSSAPPRFIHLTYRPEGASAALPSIALVGKGVTFDSGGLSIKPSTSMDEMKMDMAGAAAVLGVFSHIRQLAPNCVVHGLIPSAENMPSASSFRPGDIVRGRSGKTVEILNTDAEGRLILGDALAYATELAPTAIVDLATLTGACCVALGNNMSGLFSDHERLARALVQAGAACAEEHWRLPLSKRLFEQIKSDVADIKNLGERWGGAITAALFLQAFVGESTWAHLDIAGPAYASKDDGYHRKGGTGFGVRTLLELLSRPADWS
ncbi:MAG: leucyl aminopeptidase [Myxococcales bacterium]|nr:leucyl aminopeptidase [Myxococcales bacterium]